MLTDLPKFHSTAMLIFQWLLLTLVSYQAEYIVTTASWPPARWFRIKVKEHYGLDSAMTDFWTCPNCVGWFLTLAVFAWAGYLLNVPLLWVQAVAAARVVGKLGSTDE